MKKLLFLFALTLTACSNKSELASQLDKDYSYQRNFDMTTINALILDSAYGAHTRLNNYQQGEKRVYYYFKNIDITFEVSGEGAVNPDFIVGVYDGRKM